jgi:hypothetical protein
MEYLATHIQAAGRGTRFNYTRYEPNDGQARDLSRRGPAPEADRPIHASIEALDRAGMAAISLRNPTAAHDAFAAYLSETHNTICGRHPIGVLLAALAALPGSPRTSVDFVRYEQSSACRGIEDSSVSYASAVVRVGV